MSVNMLRQNFFEKVVATNPDGTAFEGLKGLDVCQACSGRGFLYIGGYNGEIRAVARDLSVLVFKGFELDLVRLIHLKSSPIMIAAGTDHDGEKGQCIKIWNTENVQNSAEPTLLRKIKIPAQFDPIRSIAVHEGVNHIAFGLANGEVYIGTGDILRERSFSRTFKLLFNAQKNITGLNFHPNLSHVFMYITTSHGVWGCYPDVKRIEKLTHDIKPEEGVPMIPQGASERCVAVDQAGMLWIDGREDIRGFIPEAQGKSLPFSGAKLLLEAFRGYVAVVKKPMFEGSDDLDASARVYSVTICDPKNNLIVFDEAIDNVTHVVYEWSSVFVITKNKLYQLTEKDFESKMGLLYKRHRYEVAINLAREQYKGTDGLEDILIGIFIRYANHLYKKKCFDDAIDQYIKTIGKLEPSYVIRKFLDSQRIHNLTDYLQALHDKQDKDGRPLADKYHTTLLLNCYTKLKNEEKLDEFIRNDKTLNFDLETAIKVCRQAGYYKNAVFLSRKFAQHEWYLKIQLENLHDEANALDYISRLPFAEAHVNMENYGKRLVTSLPELTTAFLKNLCSADYQPAPAFEDVVYLDKRSRRRRHDDYFKPPADPENFIHLYVDQQEHLVTFLEFMVEQRSDLNPKVYDTLLELYLRRHPDNAEDTRDRNHKVMEVLKGKKYNEHQAVILTQMYDFKDGILYLFGETKQYQQIVRYYMEKKDYNAVVSSCQIYSDAEPSLWAQALEFFANEEGCQTYLKQVLDHIDAKNLLPPLMVIEVLARYDQVSLASVKDYFTRRQQQETQSILEDEKKIEADRKKSRLMKEEIEQLTTRATVFQDNVCSFCNDQLKLPVVHFLCGHSYCQSCMPSVNECSRCRDKHTMVLSMARSHEQETHDAFTKRLDGARDRFDVVAKQFGFNMFDKHVDSNGDDGDVNATPRRRAPRENERVSFRDDNQPPPTVHTPATPASSTTTTTASTNHLSPPAQRQEQPQQTQKEAPRKTTPATANTTTPAFSGGFGMFGNNDDQWGHNGF
eukprot:m.14455 g.14455  ORF g.14455 m.14455 type:complete len:1016 (-) comp4316_c0_seq1:135-3182(-)